MNVWLRRARSSDAAAFSGSRVQVIRASQAKPGVPQIILMCHTGIQCHRLATPRESSFSPASVNRSATCSCPDIMCDPTGQDDRDLTLGPYILATSPGCGCCFAQCDLTTSGTRRRNH